VTRDQIDLLEIEGHVRQLFALAAATSLTCGSARPPSVRLISSTVAELLKLSVVFGEAEERVARRIER
jgi:hypothetical protein